MHLTTAQPVTVALLHTTLTVIVSAGSDLPVLVSSASEDVAYPITQHVRVGYFRQVESPRHQGPVGRLTSSSADGAAAVALTAEDPDPSQALQWAATTSRVAGSLMLQQPDALVLVPIGPRKDGLYAPLDHAMDTKRYEPMSGTSVWGGLPGGPMAHVLWPARPAARPEALTPTDWYGYLAQSDVCIDHRGRVRYVNALSFFEAAMALAWLKVHAGSIADRVMSDMVKNVLPRQATPAQLTRSSPSPFRVRDAHAQVWIAGTPLARELARLLQ
ncbi:hypothetical protein [Nonomuraea sp. NPDC049400]|uniref:hypothetical protein n=1 Tax=Nonomuraea sp. NPDC049400 TaxID=3364352 RepID=UPI0037BACFE5